MNNLHQLKLSRDRGSELNQRRLRGDGVDLYLKVEDLRLPAHKFIIRCYSPYLRALTEPESKFR